MSRGRETIGNTPAFPGEFGAERDAFVLRLQCILRHWPSADRLARTMGVSPSALRKWLKGEAEPSRERLIALADAAQVSIGWLAKGEGPEPAFNGGNGTVRRARAVDEHRDPMQQRFVLPPRHGGSADGRSTLRGECVAFNRDWIRADLKAEPENLIVEIASSKAMEPTICDGNLLLIDTTERALHQGGVYLLDIGGERLLKRVQRKLDGSVVLISDNPAYMPDILPVEAAKNVSAIGRVIWSGGTI